MEAHIQHSTAVPAQGRRPRTLRTDVLVGAVAGLVGSAAAAATDRLLAPLVTTRDRVWDRFARGGSPHRTVGPTVARALLGRSPSKAEARAARGVFAPAYGVVWGAAYALVRRSLPAVSRAGGLGFAVPFFALCDGVIAPLLGLTPTITGVPWRLDAKELANHVSWTAAAEAVHRAADRAGA